jgi:ribosomal-protein-serine acetyltransferase
MFTYRINENILLRLPDMTDAPALFALFEQNRDHLTEWQDWPNAIQTLGDCRQFILRHQRENAEGKTLGCLILFQEKLVGMCELTYIVPLLRKAEIGYWIAEEYEGKGIVSQSCRGLIAHAFGTMKLNRLALKFKHVSKDNENIRSRRVAERLGFTQEGILRQDGMTKGVLMDMVMCSLLAEEWRVRITHSA